MNVSAPTPHSPTADHPWSVSTIAKNLKEYINQLSVVWIEGEITQWNVSAGNVYGRLKDLEKDVTVSFTIWSSTRNRLIEDFSQGDRVVAQVKVNYWEKGGSLTMQVSHMKHAGLGDLLESIERLRSSLRQEGLFDPERKKPLPFLPQRIGLITARDSDAEKDVIRNAKLRWPNVQFLPAYASVQGDKAVDELIASLMELEKNPEIDVIIFARGGGDFQNLLAFSDERLIRAVATAKKPIVSAIGHEADRPILDDIADLRASTPTDAAKRVVPDVTEELNLVKQARTSMFNRLTQYISHQVAFLQQLQSRPALASPSWIIEQRSEEILRAQDQLRYQVERHVERLQNQHESLLNSLRMLSPQHTLKRGYSIVQDPTGAVIFDSDSLSEGDKIQITLADGGVNAEVLNKLGVESSS